MPGWGPPPARRRPPRAVVALAAVLAVVLAVGLTVLDRRTGTFGTRAPEARRTYGPPPGAVALTGRVVDGAGRPVPGATVTAYKNVGVLEGLGRAFGAVVTLGLACTTGVCTVPYGEGVTGADGRYAVYLDSEDPDDYAFFVRLGGTYLHAGLDFPGAPMRLPDVAIWDLAPRLEQRGTTARVRFTPAPRRAGRVTGYGAKVVPPGTAPGPLVKIDRLRPGATFDARRLVDVEGTLEVRAGVRTPLGDASYVATTAVRGRFPARSEGRPCVEYGLGRGAGPPVRHRPCALTDGDFEKSWPGTRFGVCRDLPCEPAVAVDLGAVRAPRYVSVHGCGDRTDVATSLDGRTWRPAVRPPREGDWCGGALTGAARYVRVTGPFFGQEREVSLYY